MLGSIARFTNDSVGLEKSLKFVQSVSQIGESIAAPYFFEAAHWTLAKEQVGLARRYFRLFKWIDCFNAAQAEYARINNKPEVKADEVHAQKLTRTSSEDDVRQLLSVSKWSFLGIYLFMEMFTISNALSITSYSWGPTLQMESLKFWFYSLAVSFVLGIYDLWLMSAAESESQPTDTSTTDSGSTENEKATKGAQAPQHTKDASAQLSSKRRAIYKQIVQDGCDMLIPASIVGWVQLDPVTVGVAGSISALLGASDAWNRVNQ
ncbi:hypothetical protein HRR83_006588 [Exophiala dermatitidis]|uniref:Peroxisomal biogenesis factor 11 n=2 Tax=Exophiala dermatitidis TaxID=5970 RepID=H6BWB5_EXODN|nr:uncharacterized protein HMPREF1120_04137 [Exophiala dermatitidis NIH/UT8656]KAJ4511343.1 hypothetical protein HRR75_005268 [Exophiala dermatitidis]EHY56031.1 hypothetical protein HMPREF1120_04137 [Exophiala dermatitidis NIH/UT8656]KAJ4514090.1 hypothetical protein HRR74_005748 [Exophiala dermatitidis]KAJ4515427.1 hypothetical protein HRR73_005259 [Exophiala dermatitidis]KAJ4533739.1 hypothetical protein HRR77_008223 [Exophiala dermatitidis]